MYCSHVESKKIKAILHFSRVTQKLHFIFRQIKNSTFCDILDMEYANSHNPHTLHEKDGIKKIAKKLE